jgi:hypothetical protein
METYAVITMETSLTQGNFPFQKGRSYYVHPGRAANLIAGGDATEGAPDGVTIFDVPAEEGAIYRFVEPIAAPAEIPAEVVNPETTNPESPEKPEPEQTEIGGAEALTPARKHRGKLSGAAVPAGPPKA